MHCSLFPEKQAMKSELCFDRLSKHRLEEINLPQQVLPVISKASKTMHSKSIYCELMVFNDILVCHDLKPFLLLDSTCNLFAETSSVRYSNGFVSRTKSYVSLSLYLKRQPSHLMPEGKQAVAPLQNIYSFSHWASTQDTFLMSKNDIDNSMCKHITAITNLSAKNVQGSI